MADTVLTIEPLTREAFQPYGWVVDRPLPSSSGQYPIPASANQGSAQRFENITFLTSRYHETEQPAKPVLSLFSCSPRSVTSHDGMLRLEVLEQHPYTSQTFCPLGLDATDSTCFLVIVAPALGSVSQNGQALPDISRLKAFVATGGQGITYAERTWHAPMIVIGRKPVNFLVIQHMNSVAEDNCEEIQLDETILVPTTTRAKSKL